MWNSLWDNSIIWAFKAFWIIMLYDHSQAGERQIPTQEPKFVFTGYPFGKKAYKVIELDSHKFYESRDLIFHEDIFPFAQQNC